MRFFKSLVRGLSSLSFKFGLVGLAVISVVVMVFGTSTVLKHALSDSGIYNSLIDNVVSVSNQNNNNQDTNLSLGEPAIKLAAHTAFNPGVIQSSTEQIIDSVYKWLGGNTAKPDFRIDLSAPKLRFAMAAADNAAARARQLPTCTLAQSRALANTTIDPFSISCLPAGTDINLVRNKVITDLANSPDFLKNPVITADNLPKDSRGKTVFDNLSHAPRIFQWVLRAPWIIGCLTLFSGGLLIFLYDEKRRGLCAVAKSVLSSGIFLLISTWIFTYALSQVNQQDGRLSKLANNAFQSNFLSILHFLSSTLGHKLFIFGAVYAGLGALALLILRFTKSKPAAL